MKKNSVNSANPKEERDSSVDLKLSRARKRVKRACDECRLHKAKCDGKVCCETCTRHDRICTYNLDSKECKTPAARIKLLEQNLSQANECIVKLEQRVHDRAFVDNNQKLVSPLESKAVCGSEPPSKVDISVSTAFHTPLLQSLLGSCLQDEAIDTMLTLHNKRVLSQKACVSSGMLAKNPCQLPTYETALELIYAAFAGVFGLSNIVVEHIFRIATQRLYDMDSFLYLQEDIEFMPLFYAVIALGMIKCSQIDQKLGYEKAYQGSLLYLEAAKIAIISDKESSCVLKIQLRLCLVLYHLETSGVDLARHLLEGLSTSTPHHELLLLASTGEPYLSRDRVSDIMWTISYLDMKISNLTKLSLLLAPTGSETTTGTPEAIDIAAHNVANLKRSSDSFLLSVSLAMAIELRKITDNVDLDKTSTDSQSHLKQWHDLETELQNWKYVFQVVFPEHECNPQLSLAKNELQVYFYLTQIDMYRSFLQDYTEIIPPYNHERFEEVSRGRACVAAAAEAILHTSTRLTQLQATNLTWTSAYTVLVSATVLLVATTYTSTTLARQELYSNIYVAIQILQSTRYGSIHCKKSYVEFLQDLSVKLTAHSKPTSLHCSGFRMNACGSSKGSLPTMTSTASPDTTMSPGSISAHDGQYVAISQLLEGQVEGEPCGEWGFDPWADEY